MSRLPLVALALVFASGPIALGDVQPFPPLLRLWFSPDGKYVLAQDTEEITVLTVETFAVHFRIPARDATLAQFTPDSSALVFVRGATLATPEKIALAHGVSHVERWSLGDGKLVASTPLPDFVCGTLVLAPDGRTYACNDYRGTLRVIDVASSETILEKPRFVQPIYHWAGTQTRVDVGNDLGESFLCYSPDGRILVAIGARNREWSNDSSLIWDVTERRRVSVKGLLRFVRGGESFAFLDSSRVLVVHWGWRKGDAVRARIVTFPDGKAIAIATIPISASMRRAADPAFLVSAPLVTTYVPSYYGSIRTWRPSGSTVAVELATGQMMVSHEGTLDVFGNYYVTEIRPGEIGLYERHKGLEANLALKHR